MGSTANVYQKLADRMSLSANEVCGMTGIGRNTVYNALASGQLRGKRIGKKKWVILVSEVNRWLSES
jgi:excisionase family DNA binding protein